MSPRTVIIPAVGKGTRLIPATKVSAKELLPVFDRVAIDFAIEEAVGAGAVRIVVVISMSKTAIRTYLGPVGKVADQEGTGSSASGPEIVYVYQDRPLGLGHAVLCCKDVVLPGPFGVILPDDIIMGQNCLAEMAAHHQAGHMVAAMPVRPEDAGHYGICRVSGRAVDRCIPVSGLVEKPAPGTAPSLIADVGRYILEPMIFDILAHTPPGKGGEVQLTDAITIAALAVPLTAFRFSGTRHDCGSHDGPLAASNARQAAVRMQARPHSSVKMFSAATTGTIHDKQGCRTVQHDLQTPRPSDAEASTCKPDFPMPSGRGGSAIPQGGRPGCRGTSHGMGGTLRKAGGNHPSRRCVGASWTSQWSGHCHDRKGSS